MIEEDENYEIKWWKDWIESDHIERLEMTKKLPILSELYKFDKLEKDMQVHMQGMLLNGFFEDLESAIYTKIRLEKERGKKE